MLIFAYYFSRITLAKYITILSGGYSYATDTGLYYLQSRYYNPKTGRFLNADGFISTGGLLGNNMFAYCNNNPVVHRDLSGTWSEYIGDNPFATIGSKIGGLISEIIRTDRNETDANGQLTVNAKLKQTGESILHSIDASIGIGMGLYAGIDLGYATEVSLGMYATNLSLSYDNGEFFAGQEYYSGAALSIASFELFSFKEDKEFRYYTDVCTVGPWGPDERFNNSWATPSPGGFVGIGGSIYLGFDLGGFFADLDRIWRRSR